jgi:hypothetical protein
MHASRAIRNKSSLKKKMHAFPLMARMAGCHYLNACISINQSINEGGKISLKQMHAFMNESGIVGEIDTCDTSSMGTVVGMVDSGSVLLGITCTVCVGLKREQRTGHQFNQ